MSPAVASRDTRRRPRRAGTPPRAIALTVSAATTAAPEALFALLDDLPGVTRAEPRLKETGWQPPGGMRPGARADLDTNVGWLAALRPLIGPARATVRVEEARRPEHARLAVEAPVARGHATLTVEPAGNPQAHHTVTVTVDVRLTGVARLRPLRRAAHRYARPSLNRVLHSVLAQAERPGYAVDSPASGIRTTNTTPP